MYLSNSACSVGLTTTCRSLWTETLAAAAAAVAVAGSLSRLSVGTVDALSNQKV